MGVDIKKIEEIADLAKTNFDKNPVFRGFSIEKYFGFLNGEVEEVKAELRENNKIYLEDELGDVLWVYFNLLNKLEDAGYVDQKRVFENCHEKFGERIAPWLESNGKGCSKWDIIKEKQKNRLKKRHENLYGEK